MAAPNRGLLVMMRSILERDEASVIRVLPPDGVVVSLADGSEWLVTAIPEAETLADLRQLSLVLTPADEGDSSSEPR